MGARKKTKAWEQIGTQWEFHTPSLRIIVHHHIDSPKDAWLVSCYDLRVERMPLASEGLESAQVETLTAIRAHVRKLETELSKCAP